jgi:hypothetical protein
MFSGGGLEILLDFVIERLAGDRCLIWCNHYDIEMLRGEVQFEWSLKQTRKSSLHCRKMINLRNTPDPRPMCSTSSQRDQASGSKTASIS